MNDTSPEIASLMREMLMARSGAERVRMCCEMFDTARALALASPHSRLINCCFPDVVNGMIAAMGLPVTCGTGNVAILANAFAGALADVSQRVQVLAHYQTIGSWRRPLS